MLENNIILLMGIAGTGKMTIGEAIVQQDRHFKLASHHTWIDPVLKLLGNDEQLLELVASYKNVLITIGQIKNVDVRVQLFNNLVKIGVYFPVIVSPNAYVSKRAMVADGTIVMHSAVINAHVSIGENCIVNT